MQHPLVRFILVTFIWSWGCWLLAALIRSQSPITAGVLSTLGGFGPSLAAALVVALDGGVQALRIWLKTCLKRDIGVRPFAWAFLLPLCVLIPAALVYVMTGGRLPPSPIAINAWLAGANFFLIFLLGGPLGEELGWRGYAWKLLREKHTWQRSSLVVGLVWGLWHLPLFYIADTLQHGLALLPFIASAVALSVVFGWLSERSHGSVLPAFILHTATNWWAWLVPGLLGGGNHRQLLLTLGMLTLVALAMFRSKQQR